MRDEELVVAAPDPEWVVPAGGSTQVLAGGQAMTLTDFLLARIAEDEARFQAHARSEREEYGPGLSPEHVAELDKALTRVMAECEAKRRIVEECKAWSDEWAAENLGGHVLRRLATIYADHPDYRDEWRP